MKRFLRMDVPEDDSEEKPFAVIYIVFFLVMMALMTVPLFLIKF